MRRFASLLRWSLSAKAGGKAELRWSQARGAHVKVTIETPEGIVVRTVSNGLLQPGQQADGVGRARGNRGPVAGGRYVVARHGDERARRRLTDAAADRSPGQGLASTASTVRPVLVASVVGGITDAVTTAIGDYGLYAIFLLMMIDAVFPAASELVMVYAARSQRAHSQTRTSSLFGHTIDTGFPPTSP